MKQDKTRKDFFLEEDYEAYRAVFAFKEAIEKHHDNMTEGQRNHLISLVDKVQSRSYSAGYSNAMFDRNEEGC